MARTSSAMAGCRTGTLPTSVGRGIPTGRGSISASGWRAGLRPRARRWWRMGLCRCSGPRGSISPRVRLRMPRGMCFSRMCQGTRFMCGRSQMRSRCSARIRAGRMAFVSMRRVTSWSVRGIMAGWSRFLPRGGMWWWRGRSEGCVSMNRMICGWTGPGGCISRTRYSSATRWCRDRSLCIT